METSEVDQYGANLCKAGFPSGVRIELRNSAA
jgi:hypothetical protein